MFEFPGAVVLVSNVNVYVYMIFKNQLTCTSYFKVTYTESSVK